jgi:hypothetical protein
MDTTTTVTKKKGGPSKIDFIVSNVKRALKSQSEWSDKVNFELTVV